MEALTPEWFEALRAFDTPTICNAIETVQGRQASTASPGERRFTFERFQEAWEAFERARV